MEFKKKEQPKTRKWHPQQEKILKGWGESSSCYRYMHFKAYQKYKATSMRFTLPIIIISTLTGTANFAQETFPESWRSIVPLGIGGFNLVAAIMTTVLQFLKANELMEAHRVASISYGKLARNIKLELQLPVYERTHNGMDMVGSCNIEYDRLVEQSPPIPGDVLSAFDKKFPASKEDFARPEISEINTIELFDSVKEQNIVSGAANIFKKNLSVASGFGKKIFGLSGNTENKTEAVVTMKKPTPVEVFSDAEVPKFSAAASKVNIMDELKALKGRGIVSKKPPGLSAPPAGEAPPVVIDIPEEVDEAAAVVDETINEVISAEAPSSSGEDGEETSPEPEAQE